MHVIKLSLGIGVDTPQSASGLSSIAARNIFRIAALLSHALSYISLRLFCGVFALVSAVASLRSFAADGVALRIEWSGADFSSFQVVGEGMVGGVASSVFSGW